MDLVKLLQDLLANVTALQTQLVDAEAAAKANYDQGFADGVASIPVSDKIFSQADLDAAVLGAVAPLQIQIDDLKAQVLALQGSVDQAVAEAVAAVKADLLVKFQALEAGEKSFEDFLK